MAYPGEDTHQKIYAMLLDDSFKAAARKAPDEAGFVRGHIRSKGLKIDIKDIAPSTQMGPHMRKLNWNLPGDSAHPHCTYYYL